MRHDERGTRENARAVARRIRALARVLVTRPAAQRTRVQPRVAWLVGAVAVAIACADVTSGPEVPASIEMAPFPFPAIVVGDTLRDSTGVPRPVRAIVRNSAGDTLTTSGVRYLYADFVRDTALVVDSVTGLVFARKAATGDARIAARVGSTLQVIKTLRVTVRPDTVTADAVPSLLTTVFPDTGRARASNNTTPAVQVVVRNRQGTTPVGVNGWLVTFAIIKPANPTNDTTQAVYLVNDNGTASVVDTTDGSGGAGRRVRVRATQFPASGTDTVVVQATVSYRGKPLPGSPARLLAPVKRGS